MNDLHRQPGMLALELEGLGFRHRDQVLLRDVNLRLPSGSRTIILGPNGAGKSLLMRLCHGLLQPTWGRVRWAGSDIQRAEAARLRQAMVFQRPVLLRRSALANIEYALSLRGLGRRARRARAIEALEHFGLGHLAARAARVLSGGEQQRLALARAWALEPEILFLDEPTSALDPAATKAVEDAVMDFHRNGTQIVMTTHDLGQAHRLAEQVVFLFQGSVLEHTPVEGFFSRPVSRQAQAFLAGELVW
ncbi:MAG: ATP-binding cassette domain-containing protein [Ectothiorhodospiraceae bacterium]|nr:ATP-binding cassette domain-containing protein [Ectothiorhodospiraceae bacterium]